MNVRRRRPAPAAAARRTGDQSRGRYTMTAPDDVTPGDVIAVGPNAWRVVTDVHDSRHGIAGAYGAVVIESVSYVTGRPMPARTIMPGQLVAVVPASWHGLTTTG